MYYNRGYSLFTCSVTSLKDGFCVKVYLRYMVTCLLVLKRIKAQQ